MHCYFLDNDQNRLYVVDFDTGDLKSVNTNGSNITNILSTGSRNNNYDLVGNGDHMYCTDYTKIIKLTKYPGTTAEIIHTQPQQITSLFVFVQNGTDCY